ncbi:MAG: UDP-2,3-diacylglucosamine diphosphatase [Rickettsiales bacterium]|nr:UDP-2,3-diacylglucosamine diphosphatase [Rickettsiales bacterium]
MQTLFDTQDDDESDRSEAYIEPRQYRTIWVSDIHLGTKDCKAEYLLDFLKFNESQTLYLVGDIIDGWRLKRGWHWPQAHSTVIQKVLRKSRKGTHVVFVPGNHDEFLRDYCGLDFGGISMEREMIHTTADGRRLLIVHGDEFDGIMKYAKWLAFVGDYAYVFALRLNRYYNFVRQKLGYPYWSLSAHLKHKVKQAVQVISDYEMYLADAARSKGLDGVVCGHIHHAEIRDIDGITYYNDGDWVESCTALVEHFDGSMEIIHWTEEMNKRGQDDSQLQLDV